MDSECPVEVNINTLHIYKTCNIFSKGQHAQTHVLFKVVAH